MGAAFLVGLLQSAADAYPHSRPETHGQRLDRAMEEQERRHRAEIRELERKVESARRLAQLGGQW
jgi:hypothetical protein